MKGLLLAIALTIVLVPVISFAGKLDDFESSATRKKHENRDSHRDHRSKKDRQDHHHHDSDDGCHGFFGCLFAVFIDVEPSYSSENTYEDTRELDNPSKDSGATVDVAYQSIESGLYGVDSSFEARFGLINFDGRFTRYVETSPFDTLDVIQANVVFPVRLGRSFTLGGALGVYQLAGNSINTGGSFGLPISYKAPGSNWEFGMKPLWVNINGNTITDVDFRASYRASKINFFAGHRAIDTGSQFLSGPYIGFGLNL
jgi:hypothetical protein